MEDCIFCKLANGDIPKVFENDDFAIIKDINPQAKLHYLAIPKKHFDNVVELAKEDNALLGRIFAKLAELKDTLGLQDGFRIIINTGENGAQSVKHIHIHLLGGEKLPENIR